MSLINHKTKGETKREIIMKNQNMKLTQAELKRILDYNPETGIFVWKIARSGIRIGDIAGCKADGYIVIRIDGKNYYAHRLAWLFVHGDWPKRDLDHEDRIRDHNWIENLREYSQSYNTINSKTPTRNTSGIRGVYYQKWKRKWYASISILGKLTHLGLYEKKIDAARARYEAELKHGYTDISSKPSDAYLYTLRYESNKALREQSNKGLIEYCLNSIDDIIF